ALYETRLHTNPLDQLEPGLDHVAPQLRQALDTPPATGAEAAVKEYSQVSQTIIRTLHAGGVPIVAGTDQAIPGYSLHRELELYVEAGFTPLEALQAATILLLAQSVLRKNQAHSRLASAATCYCSMRIHSSTFTTPVPYGEQLRQEESMTLRHSGEASGF